MLNYNPGAQPHDLTPHDQQQDVVRQKRRHKGPKRRRKIAAHQACLQSVEAAPAKLDTADPAVVKLPFSGKPLPLNTTTCSSSTSNNHHQCLHPLLRSCIQLSRNIWMWVLWRNSCFFSSCRKMMIFLLLKKSQKALWTRLFETWHISGCWGYRNKGIKFSLTGNLPSKVFTKKEHIFS